MAKKSTKQMSISNSQKAQIGRVAMLSYIMLLLVVICFFLLMAFPNVLTNASGNTCLVLLALLVGSCGRLYMFGSLFVVGTFIIYARTNDLGVVHEGIDGDPPAPSKIDPDARSAPEYTQFVSISESGQVTTSNPFVGNDGTRALIDMKPVPMVARDPFVWSWDTKNAIKEYAVKWFPSSDPKKFLDMYTERYNTSATDNEVQEWLKPTPIADGGTLHMFPWSHSIKEEYKKGSRYILVEALKEVDGEIFDKYYGVFEMLTRHQLTELNVEVLLRSTFLFDKWVKYMFEYIKMYFTQ